MDSIAFEYGVNVSDYRKMIYFNIFSLKRYQNFLIILIWICGTISLFLDLFGVINPTDIMHLCFIIVSITVPVLVLYAEIMVKRFRKNNAEDYSSNLTTFNDTGVRFERKTVGGSGFSKWNEFIAVYETKTMFILYKDMNRTALIPKENISQTKILETRSFLKKYMDNCFIQRCK